MSDDGRLLRGGRRAFGTGTYAFFIGQVFMPSIE
jgi:hypothetical protein